MSDDFKSWNHSAAQPTADSDSDADHSPRRIVAIVLASLLVVALIAGTVGFVAKRYVDAKDEEAKQKEAERIKNAAAAAARDPTEVFTNPVEDIEEASADAKP